MVVDVFARIVCVLLRWFGWLLACLSVMLPGRPVWQQVCVRVCARGRVRGFLRECAIVPWYVVLSRSGVQSEYT